MATDKATAEGILAQLLAVADARMRPMFGEYVVYVDEKVIGQINEGRLSIKVTKFGEQFAPKLERASPYPGAKPTFVVPPEKLADAACPRNFVSGTRRQLK